MDFLPHETEIKVFEYLSKIGCCVSCCLRLIGCRNIEYFEKPVEYSKKLKYIDESFEVNEDIPCVACLGILQPNVQEQVVEETLKVIISEDYDSPTFTCALSIPMSLRLREKSIDISIQNQFSLEVNLLTQLRLKTESIKDTWKIQMLSKMAAKIDKKSLSGPTPSSFIIDISLIHESDEYEWETLLKKCDPNYNKKRNRNIKYSRNNIEKVLSTIDSKEIAAFFPSPPGKTKDFIKIDRISCTHAGIFVGGRYNKLSRQLSQTPWFVNGEKKMESSVQDLLCDELVKATHADSLKFLSSGREDVDVRTINSGRPFAVELVNPKRTKIDDEEMREVCERINASTDLVKITSDLKFLTTTDLKMLKEGENNKSKFYRALCTIRKGTRESIDLTNLEGLKNLKIVQKTPIRVLHRRPLASRPRILYAIRGRWLTEDEISNLAKSVSNAILKDLFVIDVKTQAGTYIKEFVHGDFGRTKPSLGDLLEQDVDIVALDVTGINLHWP